MSTMTRLAGCGVVANTMWQTLARRRRRRLVFAALLAIMTLAVVLAAQSGAWAVNVPAGTDPMAVAVNVVTNKIYVANYISNNVTFIDGATNAVSTVAAGSDPWAVAVNPVTDKIYVADKGNGDVTIIDGATNTASAVAAGSEPWALAVDSITDKIYVANISSDDVTVIEGPTHGPVYRFRSLKNGSYLWSADENEKATIISTLSKSWRYEGVAYTIDTANPLNSSALWRFVNLKGGYYLYSADPAEKADIVANLSKSWLCEGPAYNVSIDSSGAPVWRFRNLKNGTYLYSADVNEKDTIVNTLSKTWQLEGPAFYIAP